MSGAQTVSIDESKIESAITGSAACTTYSISGSGTSERTVTLSGCSGDGTLKIKILAGAVKSSGCVGNEESTESSSVTIVPNGVVDFSPSRLNHYTDEGDWQKNGVMFNESAIAALKADGSVVTWGDPYSGGDSTGINWH